MSLLLSNISMILNTVIRLIYVYINIHVYVSIFIVIFTVVLMVKASMALFRELLNCKLCNVMVNLFTFHWNHICQSAALFCVFWLKTATWRNFLSITFKLLSVFFYLLEMVISCDIWNLRCICFIWYGFPHSVLIWQAVHCSKSYETHFCKLIIMPIFVGFFQKML